MTKTQKRRRRESKTDYNARFSLLKSGKPRLVIRKTNRFILAQIVESDNAQDRILIRASSKDLLRYGWPKEKSGSLKSLQAAYLTGFLLARKTKGKIKEAILDTGLIRTVHGSRIFSLLRGIIDCGLLIKHKKVALPTDDRLKVNEKLKSLLEIKERL